MAAARKALSGHLAALQDQGNAAQAADPALLKELLNGLALLQQSGCGAGVHLNGAC